MYKTYKRNLTFHKIKHGMNNTKITPQGINNHTHLSNASSSCIAPRYFVKGNIRLKRFCEKISAKAFGKT